MGGNFGISDVCVCGFRILLSVCGGIGMVWVGGGGGVGGVVVVWNLCGVVVKVVCVVCIVVGFGNLGLGL